MNWRLPVAAGLLLLGAAALGRTPAAPAPTGELEVGAAIYLRGVLGSGAPLEGRRDSGLNSRGAEAACVSCHQRSGLGSADGSITIPPIAGRYLFQPRVQQRSAPDLPYVDTMRPDRAPYTAATLARAIRSGVDSDGKALRVLMPRYALDDADLQALIAYLNELAPSRVPGVTDTVLYFATIVTPDADPVARSGMLDVLRHYVDEKNAFMLRPSPGIRAVGRGIYGKSMYRANRRWHLYVWNLTGPAATWQAQLARHLAQEPVMAVLSGLGRSDWTPVHDFCEQQHLPCLFPNVEVPATAGGDFYSLYFSDGVLLEARLLARAIGAAPAGGAIKSVLQIFRAGDSGAAAARSLAALLKGRGITARERILGAEPPGRGIREALRGAASADALVLWLRPADIAALGNVAAAPRTVYMSGLMGGLEAAPLPPAWRGRTLLAYPFDLSPGRVIRVDFPLGWFRIKAIPLVAPTVQLDTYLACGVLAETLNTMADNFDRDYLVEQLEHLLEHRYLTGLYPRLALAPGQNFASKGGYIVKFAEPTGTRLLPDGGWTVP